jgi:restriction system protein
VTAFSVFRNGVRHAARSSNGRLAMRSNSVLSKDPQGPAAVTAMNGRELERLIGDAFRARGFTVTGFGAGSRRGAELALKKNGQRYLVQLEHWRKEEVGALAIREFGALMQSAAVRGGYVVSAGRFTREARELALERRIQLIDGEALAELAAAGTVACD